MFVCVKGEMNEKRDFLEQKEQFILEEKFNEKAGKTLVHYRHIIETFIDFLPDDKEITKKDIIDYKNELLTKHKPSTISNYITVANKYIKYVEIMKKMVNLILKSLKSINLN